MKRTTFPQRAPATDTISYAGYWSPPEVISYDVGLYYRFPLSRRMVEDRLAARGIQLTYGTVRRLSVKFGLGIARRIRSTVLARADKWQLDGRKHWLWRAVDQHGAALDVLVQRRGKHGRAPRVLITNQLRSYAAANPDLGLKVEHRQHKGPNYRAENSHQPTRGREKVMRRFKSARHLQRFASVHDQVGNLFLHCRYHTDAKQKRALRAEGFEALESVTGSLMLGRLAD